MSLGISRKLNIPSWNQTPETNPTDNRKTSCATKTQQVQETTKQNQTRKYAQKIYFHAETPMDWIQLTLGDKFKAKGRKFEVCENSEGALHAVEKFNCFKKFLNYISNKPEKSSLLAREIDMVMCHGKQKKYEIETDETLFCRAVKDKNNQWVLPAGRIPEKYGKLTSIPCMDDIRKNNPSGAVPVFYNMRLIHILKDAKEDGAKVIIRAASNWREANIRQFLTQQGLEVDDFHDAASLKKQEDSNLEEKYVEIKGQQLPIKKFHIDSRKPPPAQVALPTP